MTVRLRETLVRARARARSGRDEGVSPVIGMILVMAISIVGIAAILYWGLPAIDEMKANVEYRSVTTQFSELDSTIKELVAGTTEKTAKRWQPVLNRGNVVVQNNTEAWLFATETYNASANHDLIWSGLADGDATFTVRSKTLLTWVKVEAYVVTGTTTQTALNVTLASSPNDDQMTGANLLAWTADTDQSFKVWVKDAGTNTAKNVQGGTFRFKVYTGSTLIAEAYYTNTGRVDYSLHAGVSDRALVVNNGALLAGTSGTYTIVNTPSIPPPSQTGGVYRFFGRAVTIGGNASFAGDDRFDLLISLYSTATLASYDCSQADGSDCAETSKIFVYGTYQDAWHSYLTNAGKGYRFTEKTHGTMTYLEQRESRMAYTLLASNVIMSG